MFRFSHLAFAASILLTSGSLAAADDGHNHDDHGHGPKQSLGLATVGDVQFDLAYAGALTPGSEVHLEMSAKPESASFTTIRVWIGLENGRGSEKARAEAEAGHAGHWSAHVAVPKPLPEGSRLWIQTQVAQGNPVLSNVALPAAGAAPQAAPAHDHGKEAGDDHKGHDH